MSQQLRLVLMGHTGVGKSSLGNTILNQRVFRSSSQGSSTTKVCQLWNGFVNNRQISVVDTPGYMDTEAENQGDIIKEIERSISVSCPGPHAICYVVQIGRFTTENVKTFKAFVKHFGNDFYKYVIIVFTRFDDFKRDCDEDEVNYDIQNYISTLPRTVREFVVNKCKSRVIGMDNTLKGVKSQTQLDTLFQTIDRLREQNESTCYSINDLKKAKAAIQDRQNRENAIHKRERMYQLEKPNLMIKENTDSKARIKMGKQKVYKTEFSYIKKDGNILRGRDGQYEKLNTISKKLIEKLTQANNKDYDLSGQNNNSGKGCDRSNKQDQTEEEIKEMVVKNFRYGPLTWKPDINSTGKIGGKIKGEAGLRLGDISYEKSSKDIQRHVKVWNLEAKGKAKVSASFKRKGKKQAFKAKAKGKVGLTGLKFRRKQNSRSSTGVKVKLGYLKAEAKASLKFNKKKLKELSARASLNVAGFNYLNGDMQKTEDTNEPNMSLKAGLVKASALNAQMVGIKSGKKSNIVSENTIAEANLGNFSMTGIDNRKSEVVNKQFKLNTTAQANIGNIKITGIGAKGHKFDVQTTPGCDMFNVSAGINRETGSIISSRTSFFNVDLSVGSPKYNLNVTKGKFNFAIPFFGGGSGGESGGENDGSRKERGSSSSSGDKDGNDNESCWDKGGMKKGGGNRDHGCDKGGNKKSSGSKESGGDKGDSTKCGGSSERGGHKSWKVSGSSESFSDRGGVSTGRCIENDVRDECNSGVSVESGERDNESGVTSSVSVDSGGATLVEGDGNDVGDVGSDGRNCGNYVSDKDNDESFCSSVDSNCVSSDRSSKKVESNVVSDESKSGCNNSGGNVDKRNSVSLQSGEDSVIGSVTGSECAGDSGKIGGESGEIHGVRGECYGDRGEIVDGSCNGDSGSSENVNCNGENGGHSDGNLNESGESFGMSVENGGVSDEISCGSFENNVISNKSNNGYDNSGASVSESGSDKGESGSDSLETDGGSENGEDSIESVGGNGKNSDEVNFDENNTAGDNQFEGNGNIRYEDVGVLNRHRSEQATEQTSNAWHGTGPNSKNYSPISEFEIQVNVLRNIDEDEYSKSHQNQTIINSAIDDFDDQGTYNSYSFNINIDSNAISTKNMDTSSDISADSDNEHKANYRNNESPSPDKTMCCNGEKSELIKANGLGVICLNQISDNDTDVHQRLISSIDGVYDDIQGVNTQKYDSNKAMCRQSKLTNPEINASSSSSCYERKRQPKCGTTHPPRIDSTNLMDPADFNKCMFKVVEQRMNQNCIRNHNFDRPAAETTDSTYNCWQDTGKVEQYLFDQYAPPTNHQEASSASYNTSDAYQKSKRPNKTSNRKPFGSKKNIHTIFTLGDYDTKEITQKGNIACFRDDD